MQKSIITKFLLSLFLLWSFSAEAFLVDSDLFATDSGWTKVTSAGSYTVTGGTGLFTAGSGGLNSLGFRRTTGRVAQIGDQFIASLKESSNSTVNWLCGITTSTSFDFATSRYAYYVDGGSPNAYEWDSPASAALGINGSTSFVTVKIQIRSDGFADLYVDDVLRGTSSNLGSAPSLIGSTVYWVCHVDTVNGSSGTLAVDNFFVCSSADCSVASPQNTGLGSALRRSHHQQLIRKFKERED